MMKGFMDAAAEEGGESPTSLLDEMNVDSIVDVLNARSGISNASIAEVSEGKLIIGYDFNNIETLNLSMQDDAMSSMLQGAGGDAGMGGSPSSGASITKKGKKITYSTGDMTDVADAEDLEGMGSMMTFNVKMTFPREIKKVKNKDAEISADGKSVTVSANFEELLNGDKKPGMQVKLK